MKNKPLIEPSIGVLGLPSHSIVDPKILGSLVRPDQVDLPLETGTPVLVRGQSLVGGLLELGHQLIGVSHKEVDEVLPIDRLKVSPIWEQKRN